VAFHHASLPTFSPIFSQQNWLAIFPAYWKMPCRCSKLTIITVLNVNALQFLSNIFLRLKIIQGHQRRHGQKAVARAKAAVKSFVPEVCLLLQNVAAPLTVKHLLKKLVRVQECLMGPKVSLWVEASRWLLQVWPVQWWSNVH